VDLLGGQVGATRLVIAILLVISAAATLGTRLVVRAEASAVHRDPPTG
jgi:hypothetical protein